jgi:signal transduction histidine kinase
MNVLDYMLKYSRESVYWKDTQGRYLGCNQVFADIAGVYSPADLIGKTDRQLFINFLGDEGISAIEQLDQQVIMTGREIVSEEVGIDSHSQLAIYISNKNPLRDEHQRIIGVFGISFNIADKYHAEALRITNQRQIEVIQSQEKLAGIAAQVVHDIASPLASLKMLVDCSKELAEPRRVALQKVARSIEDITKQLLNQYNPAKIAAQETEEEPAVFLPGLILQDLIEDRMMRYRSSRIQFELEIPSELYFEGLHAQRSQFMRMISNLINNAIDAMNGDVSPSEQIIRLKLSKDHEGIHILIQDTGCGMTQDQVHKIMNAVSFSHGKAEGHGIGFTQIRKMLANNQGLARQLKSHSPSMVYRIGRLISYPYYPKIY